MTMALINWKTGGALGGVMAGAAIAGPVGAILGGGLGLLFGSQVEHDKAAGIPTKVVGTASPAPVAATKPAAPPAVAPEAKP